MTDPFEPGTSVVVRNLRDGRVRVAEPAIVVEDTPERLLWFRPNGTPTKTAASSLAPREGGAREHASRADRVRLGFIVPGHAASVDAAVDDVLVAIREHNCPFDGSFDRWRPDPSWIAPTLPEEWGSPGLRVAPEARRRKRGTVPFGALRGETYAVLV